MSLYKDASLVMIPSAYKDGKLYSIRPTDGGGDFTFSRGSNLAATRVDVNGLIEKGRENLVKYSNDFSNAAWNKISGASVVGKTATDPFGVANNAWVVSFNGTAGGRIEQAITGVINGGVYASSIYARVQSGTQDVDFGTGPTGDTFTLTTSWQRISLFEVETDTTGYPRIICNDANTLEIYAAQVEQGLVATDYIETGASTAQAGILEDMPRLDYSGSCPALLLEPQRTNIVTQSDANANWNMVANVTNALTQDVLSPEGVYNAWSARRNINTSGYTYMTNLPVSPNTTYTASVWLKANDLSICDAVVFNFHPNSFASKSTILSFEDGSVTGDGVVESYPNGWYRVSLTSTSNASIGYFDVGLQPLLNGDVYWGGSDGDVLWYAYGTQVEAGSYPTSYIPTYGSSVTRSQEYGRTPHSAYEINEEQGVIFAEFEYLGGTDFQVVSMHNGGSLVDWLMVDSAGKLRGSVFYNSTYQVSMDSSPTTLSPNTYYKAAFRYESGNNALYLNGVKVGTNTQTFVNPPTLPYVQVGGFWQLSNTNVNCKIKQTALFNTALTDAELAALTA